MSGEAPTAPPVEGVLNPNNCLGPIGPISPIRPIKK